MSTTTSTNSSIRERPPPTSELSAIMFSEISPRHYHHHHQEKLPLSYVHIPLNQNGSSSGTSEISSITRLAHAASVRYGSPPTSIGDVSYSMFSSCINDPSTTMGPSASTGTSTFRLEPKFGPNTKLRSNPPFWSSNSSTGVRGRKRTAQSMALNNSNSVAITRSGLVGSRTPRRNHPDHHRSGSHATTPASPRYVDSAVFNLQGLSLRSPASTISGVNYNSTTDFRTTPNNAFVASPAATHSSFTACGSSSFSRVNTSFASTATVDGTSPFRTYRSGSFGGSTLEMPGELDIVNDGSMPPPASIDISSSSPRIVPLTVLTHDSVPTSQTLASAQCHRRNLSFGSSVAGARPPMQHALPMGISPLLLSVGSSSTSDDCHSGAVPATVRRNADEIDEIFRNDHEMLTKTPQSRPPFVSVQYCPDSTHTTMSILADSPTTAYADQKGTPSTTTNKHGNHLTSTASVALPKVTLTPRSGVSSSNVMAGLPSFPSPNSTSNDHHDTTIVLPRTSSRINRSIRINRSVPTPSRDVSVLTEAGDTESCSLDLSVDNASATKRNAHTTANNVIRRSNTKSNVSDPVPTPRTCYSRKSEMERLSSTMTSTPSAVSNVSLKEMIIDVDASRFPASSHGGIEVDTESLSDGDDDEFFLAVPSSLVEEKQSEAARTVRRSKLPRLLRAESSTQVLNGHPGNPTRNHTSMTSFGSQNTLLGTGFAMSSTSLRGMDALPNQFGMPDHLPVINQSSLVFSECTGTSVNGYTMERVGSMTSIGLDLDRPSEKPNVPFVGRDLVTPPVMLEPSQPPALSPRLGSRNADIWMATTTTNDRTAAEADTRPSEDYLYYDSTKRTVA